MIGALESFLDKRDSKIRILLQESNKVISDNKSSSTFLKICSSSKKMELKQTQKKDSEIIEHFIVMDNTGYRFCPNRDLTEAVASFGRPTTTNNLLKQFNIIFERATILNIS